MIVVKVYGPYLRKDGRKHVILRYADGTRRTQSYPRFVLESELGISLPDDLDVDHVDNDKTNDRPSNWQLLSRSDNVKKQRNAA